MSWLAGCTTFTRNWNVAGCIFTGRSEKTNNTHREQFSSIKTYIPYKTYPQRDYYTPQYINISIFPYLANFRIGNATIKVGEG